MLSLTLASPFFLSCVVSSVSESQSAADLEAAVEVMVQEGWDEDVARQVRHKNICDSTQWI